MDPGSEVSPPTPHPHGDVDYTKEYKINTILAENERQYLIDWADDEETGEHYEPTWEPKRFANREAINDWKQQKAQKAAQSKQQGTQPSSSSTPIKKRVGRPRKVIESSPEASPALIREEFPQSSPQQPLEAPSTAESTRAVETEVPEIVESQQEDVQNLPADASDQGSPLFVQPSEPPASFEAGEYQQFSSSAAVEGSDPTASAPQGFLAAQPGSLPSPPVGHSRSVRVNFGESATRVIPDSQSAAELVSSSAPAAITSDSTAAPEVSSEACVVDQQQRLSQPADREDAPQPTAQSVSGGIDENPSIETQGSGVYAASHLQGQHDLGGKQAGITVSLQEQAAPVDLGASSQDWSQLSGPPVREQLASDSIVSPQQLHPHASSPSRDAASRQTPDSESQSLQTIRPFQTFPQAEESVNREQGRTYPDQRPRLPTPEIGPVGDSPITATEVQKESFNRTQLSSLPFQTQVARPTSSGSLSDSQNIKGQAQRFSSSAFAERASSQPARASSPFETSSPIASVPPFTSGTIGDSAPPQPVTISSGRAMDSSQASQRSVGDTSQLAAKLKLIQQQGKAKREGKAPTSVPSQAVVNQQEPAQLTQASPESPAGPPSQPPKIVSSLLEIEQNRRSPSQVPAKEPIPNITQEEMNTSERYETLVPQARESVAEDQRRPASGAGSASLSRQQTTSQEDGGPRSYVVPVALLGHQRDQYPQTLWWGRGLVERFLAASSPSTEDINEAEHLLERLRRILVHPDLDNVDTLTQYDVEPRQDAQWAIDCSAKFRLLKILLDGIRDQTLHIAIVTQSERLLQILATFLTGINVPHRFLHDITGSNISNDHEGLMVTLVAVGGEGGLGQPSPADMVMTLEPSISDDNSTVAAFAPNAGHESIFITLVVPGSMEHIDMSVSSTLASPLRLRALISGAWEYRNEAGRLAEGDLTPDTVGSLIAQYISAEEEQRQWPLVSLEPLPDLDSQTESDLQHTSEDAHAGNKRSLIVDDFTTEKNGKKARHDQPQTSEMPVTINPQDIEITYVSDSVGRSDQALTSSDPTSQPALLTDTERRLHRMLKEVQDRLMEMEQNMSELQFRHEEQRAQLVEVTAARDGAIVTAERAVNKMRELNETVSTLKQDRTALNSRLEDANVRLQNHSVPELGELEKVRLQAEHARAEKEQLEKRLKSAQEENEYSRAGYQTASQSAQSLSSQNTELENQVLMLQKTATGEQAKLRDMGYDAHSKSLQEENRKLKAMLKDRETVMKFKDEEIARLKEANRGRMSTRGSSVPRSPRIGSPAKMDGVRGGGSRQASPAASELRNKSGHLHPLRNS
ncbi:hypothetical protein D0868_06489 [Hortaea werneckii]|uniref:Chromo domain-containing protein n=1 Tax=Hortaea werneckii TaxID=91943 RepID=A0A3M6YQY5_HORWE|nr:hypothetical protein D0868_06489 [Hortaea werneckii]